ncbi:MAG: helix-turn-helix domain-containing protein [Bauldia litoralis]
MPPNTIPRVEAQSIGPLSAQTGVNIGTIRYYERIGLLPAPPRTQGGRRIYSAEHRRRLVFIRRMRELGFPIEDVRALLGMVDGGYACADVHALTVRHLDDMRRRIGDLTRVAAILEDMADRCATGETPGCPIVEALNPD